MIHIGIDTVNLQGKYFTAHVDVGTQVEKGDLMISFDGEKIQKEGYDIITPVLIANMAQFTSIDVQKDGKAAAGEPLMIIS